jgi:4-amino-4-deoxy-L-arabinose transferase-like glycosyltransferase
VRLFGLNSWSVMAPQALEGVAAVALLYAAVRRAAGPSAALLAGAVFALTPVAALMFRFNNPDSLLVLALVAGAYCVQRGCERDSSRWWLMGAGAAVGIGFLAKMLQAFLVLPAFGAAYLVAAAVPLRTRLVRMVGAVVAMVVGWGRLFGNSMGTYIAWLIPAAVVCIVAGLLITRRAPRTDPTRAGLILWGGWLAVTAVVFSYANGILHQYYTVALAPPIGAGIGIGAVLLWRNRFDIRAAVAMSATVLVTVILAAVLLARRFDWLPWLGTVIAVAGVAAAVLLLVAGRLPARVASGVAALAVLACLAAPTAYALATVATPHSGAIPSVGPSRGHGSFGGRGGPGGGFLDIPEAGPGLTALLSDGADRYEWTAAVVGSSNAAGFQLAGGAPVMAVGGFNGTDPAPTLAEFQSDVAAGRIHYFIRGHSMFGMPMGRGTTGSRDAADISSWVKAHYSEKTVDGVVVYDLTETPTNS